MSAINSDVSNDYPKQWLKEDDIDIKKYLFFLIKWRLEVAAIALALVLLAVIGVLTIRQITTPEYMASTTIAIARVKSDVTFDERFRTTSNEEARLPKAESDSRRAALLGLVYDGDIAEIISQELNDGLLGEFASDQEEVIPAELIDSISAQIIIGQDGRTESDLIRISAQADDPDKAAAISNAWAKYYVEKVNILYGQVPTDVVDSVESELVRTETVYQETQRELESFIAANRIRPVQREISEKQGIISSLQIGKQTAVDTIVEEELNARRRTISAYINALAQNQLLAFQKEQEAKTTLVNTYIDAAVQSRIMAIEEDRIARESLFETLVDLQIESVTAVASEQVQGQIDLLRQTYRSRLEVAKILSQARILQNQIELAGDSGISSNGTALLLLKAQVASIPTMEQRDSGGQSLASEGVLNTPENSQSGDSTSLNVPSTTLNTPIINNIGQDSRSSFVTLNVDSTVADNAEGLLADINAFVSALEEAMASFDTSIEATSLELVNGENYSLENITADHLGVSAENSAGEESVASVEVESNNSTLSQAIVERYSDLFGLGDLANTTQDFSKDSALYAQLESLYPELFSIDNIANLAENIPDDTPLAILSLEKAQHLLQLQGLEDVSEYTTSAQPLIQAIDKLDQEIQALEAQLEAELSRELQLKQRRDLAWETFKTLTNKSAELALAQSATNREVRLASSAVPPIKPVSRLGLVSTTLVAGLLGLALGLLFAIISNLLGHEPFFSRKRASQNDSAGVAA